MDIEKTKHFTTHQTSICGNLTKYVPAQAQLIEPFCGDGDLLTLFPNHTWECYDIEMHRNVQQRDTLINPPIYTNKWVVTNPPYLAQNKAQDKTIYKLYNTDDLYKASILSILDCEGGILIIPTNFFTDEHTEKIRKIFLSKFKINELNIFTEPVFETTTYSICSFAFEKANLDKQVIPVNILPNGNKINIELNKKYGYRIAGEFYSKINSTPNIFGRVINGVNNSDYVLPIKLYALDTRTERIRLEYNENIYYGKNSDRIYASLTSKIELSNEQIQNLINSFNNELEEFRKTYSDLSLTNYRDYNRKRIGFDFAYKLLSYIYSKSQEN